VLTVAIFICLGWILSVCLHEFGHAIVAYWGGDTSVKDKGYLTLNPLKYLDFGMSIILPVIFLLIGGIALPGAAVYIDRRRLSNRWWQSAVSAAGPLASALVAVVLTIPFWLGLSLYQDWVGPALAFLIFLQISVVLFNLLPIPPLDGYGIIEPWLPLPAQIQFKKFSTYGLIAIFAAFWFIEPLNQVFWSIAYTISKTLGVPSGMVMQGAQLFNRGSTVLLLAVIVILALISRVKRKRHDVYYERGNSLSKRGRYEEAIAAYDQAVHIKSDFAEAWYQRGVALAYLERYEEAIAAYKTAVEIKPDYSEAWYSRGWVLQQLRRYSEALAAYDQAMQIQPELYQAGYQRGLVLAALERYAEAMAAYNQVLQIQPDYYEAAYQRGVVLSCLQKYEQAIASYDQALKIKPGNRQILTDKGWAFCQLQRYEDAIAVFEKVIRLQPDYYQAWYKLGWSLWKLGKSEEAVFAFDRVTQLQPSYANAWYNKACYYARKGSVDLVLENLKQAIQLEPDRFSKEAQQDADFESIKGNKLFQQLIKLGTNPSNCT